MKLQALLTNKMTKRAIHVLNLPLYYFSKLVPKRSDLWLFGSWYGQKYADSSKYLFEYVSQNHPEIKAIWLTNDRATLELIKKKGYPVFNAYSLKGYWLSMRARFGFVVTCTGDLNFFINPKEVINLWHGNPLKKIMHDDRFHFIAPAQNRLKRILSPYARDQRFDYTLASSELEATNLASAFNTNSSRILVTGLPRNQVFAKPVDPNRTSYNVMYMPTHRGQGEFDVTQFFSDEIDQINTRLAESEITLWVKLHFYDMQRLPTLHYTNIRFLDDQQIEQDIYSVMDQVDLLATDYSSVYFDYLLADRPLVFLPFDLEDYMAGERELYYDYDDVTPGPKCRSWSEAIDWFEKFKEQPERFSEERSRIKSLFHNARADEICENVFRTVRQLQNRESANSSLSVVNVQATAKVRG